MPENRDVFISYASRDRARVVRIANALADAGVSIWRDQDEILGGQNFGPEIVNAIQQCQVMLVMCSAASMASKNVQTEISLAWDSGCCYLPILLDDSVTTAFPNQVRYWLQRSQWIVVRDRPTKAWLPEVLRSLKSAGIACQPLADGESSQPTVPLIRPLQTLESLLQMSAFTDRICPVKPQHVKSSPRGVTRDMGGLPLTPENSFRLGDWVCLRLRIDRPGYLRLINIGTSGKVYGLCPSKFAPDMQLKVGETVFPQEGSPWEAFQISGAAGREELLAIITDEPLDLDWTPSHPSQPARLLDTHDCDQLLSKLRELQPAQWTAESTYFDVLS